MKKLLFIPLILLTLASTALPTGWVVTVSNEAYTDLSNPTVLPLAPGWDDPDAVIPLGFTHSIGGNSTSNMYIDGSNLSLGLELTTGLSGIVNIYNAIVDIVDRASVMGNPASTISHKTDGTSGNQIAKIEWNNAGFYSEFSDSNTTNDFINMQAWFYEADNAFELRFGNSQIANFEHRIEATKVPFGITDSYDMALDEFDAWNYLTSLNPVSIDSFNSSNYPSNDWGISVWPANGTVIRFAPGFAVGVDNKVKLNDELSFYPTLVNSEAHLDFANPIQGDAVIRIMDMSGRVVSQQKVTGQTNTIDMNNLPASNYVLQAQYNNQSVFYQFTKK